MKPARPMAPSDRQLAQALLDQATKGADLAVDMAEAMARLMARHLRRRRAGKEKTAGGGTR